MVRVFGSYFSLNLLFLSRNLFDYLFDWVKKRSHEHEIVVSSWNKYLSSIVVSEIIMVKVVIMVKVLESSFRCTSTKRCTLDLHQVYLYLLGPKSAHWSISCWKCCFKHRKTGVFWVQNRKREKSVKKLFLSTYVTDH